MKLILKIVMYLQAILLNIVLYFSGYTCEGGFKCMTDERAVHCCEQVYPRLTCPSGKQCCPASVKCNY